MAGRGHLLDALPKGTTATNQDKNLGLIKRNLDCTRPDEVRRCADLSKLRVHSFSLLLLQILLTKKGAALAAPWRCRNSLCLAAVRRIQHTGAHQLGLHRDALLDAEACERTINCTRFDRVH